jgi:glucose-1-phosphate cytidylyltransferase
MGLLGKDLGISVVILAGGVGTRLAEETGTRPKPMVEIGGKPILWHIMKIYSHYGFEDFVLCLGYKGDAIRDFFLQYDFHNQDVTIELGDRRITSHDPHNDEHGWRVTLAETGLHTSTGGRIKRVERYVRGDTFMMTYGDGVSDINLASLLAFHREMGRIATVTGVRPGARFGELDVQGNIARRFREKPQVQEGWINGGFFVFEREIFERLNGDECVLEGEPLETLASEEELSVFKHLGYWQCMDTLRDVRLLENQWEAGDAPWAVWRE